MPPLQGLNAKTCSAVTHDFRRGLLYAGPTALRFPQITMRVAGLCLGGLLGCGLWHEAFEQRFELCIQAQCFGLVLE